MSGKNKEGVGKKTKYKKSIVQQCSIIANKEENAERKSSDKIALMCFAREDRDN